MNEVLRTSYVRDCELGLKRWNRQLERAGIGQRLALPSPRFHRAIGVWAGVRCDPAGTIIDDERISPARERMAADEADRAFVQQPDAEGHRAREDGRLDCAAPSAASTTFRSNTSTCGYSNRTSGPSWEL